MEKKSPKILIIYFSLSGQSRGLVNLLSSGLEQEGNTVFIEKIKAQKKISFPFRGIIHTIKMMFSTLIRWRIPIRDLSPECYDNYDLIILAGPTWSYNPSGPVLSLLDKSGPSLFCGKRVLPVISCRGYYRIHNFLLRRQLKKIGAILEKSLIFTHQVAEPWSSLGVFFKSAGYDPEKMYYLKDHYPHFGHTAEQLHKAREYGRYIGRSIKSNTPVGSLDFH